MKQKLTIFTPTYNREHYLQRLYESLCQQTCQNFKWLIIDDGSSDSTKSSVQRMINENKISIQYLYKENGGKHTAINLMLDIIDSELVMIVDSDDFLYSNAVQIILEDYSQLKRNDLCELTYRRSHFNGEIIGNRFLEEGIIDIQDCLMNGKVKGDPANVWIVEKWKEFRFPEYLNENFMGEGVLVAQVYEKFPYAFVSNQPIYYCEYMECGLTRAGRKLRISMPLGGMEYARSYIKSKIRLHIQFKYTVLYVCYAHFAKFSFKEMLSGFPKKCLLPLGYMPGKVLYFYWKAKHTK